MVLTDVLEEHLDEEVAAHMPEWFTIIREAFRKWANRIIP